MASSSSLPDSPDAPDVDRASALQAQIRECEETVRSLREFTADVKAQTSKSEKLIQEFQSLQANVAWALDMCNAERNGMESKCNKLSIHNWMSQAEIVRLTDEVERLTDEIIPLEAKMTRRRSSEDLFGEKKSPRRQLSKEMVQPGSSSELSLVPTKRRSQSR